MTDAEIKNLSYGFAEWFKGENDRDVDYEEDYVEDLFNEYAQYLMEEEEADDEELMTEMYAVVQYYGEEGYVFQDWYEQRECDSADCVEYDEWLNLVKPTEAMDTQEHLNAIKVAALEFWIDYNYEVAQGRKEGGEWLDEEEEEGNGWENGIIPNCEKCGNKFAEDGNNYNERDGDEICDDCDVEVEE